MIRLNRAIERAKRRRWLWILLVILLAVLLALVALHSFNDSVETDGAVFCAAVILLVAVAIVRPVEPALITLPVQVSRGPPLSVVLIAPSRALTSFSFAPLRL